MMFCVVVGIPQQHSNDQVRSNTSRVAKAVGVLGYLTIGVFEVSEVVHHGVSNQHWNDPPKGDIHQTVQVTTEQAKDGNVVKNLLDRSHLQISHDTTFVAVCPFLEAPSPAAVVNWVPSGRPDDATNSALPSVGNVQELAEVADTAEGDVSKAGILEFFAGVVAGELGVLVDVVGVRMVLLVHDTLMGTKLTTEHTDVKQT